MISRESLLHIPKSNMSYGYDQETLHIRVRTKRDDVDQITLRIGDPYIWDKGGADGGNLDARNAYGWSGSTELRMQKESSTQYFDYWHVFYKPEKKRSRYAFIMTDHDETILFGERKILTLNDDNQYTLNEMSNFFCFPYLNGIDVHKIPNWVKDTVWYQIFPDRFNNGDASLDTDYVQPWGTKPTYDNFMGGDIKGITEKLDYLVSLGINGIYLCPIFKAGTNHRYDTIDYLAIDEMLGDEAALKTLIDESHKRGIKIMLDAVFNHMGHLSKQWQDVVEHGESSQYKDWFCIHKFPVYDKPFDLLDGNHLNYETFGRTKRMPKVNTEHPDVIEYFLEVGAYWVKEFNIDAWRIDVANEVDHNFWRLFRKRVHAINPEVFLLGEIWHDANPWLQGDQFDVAMNYPLTEAIIQYFCTDDLDRISFIHAVNKVKVSYTLQVSENNFNLLDSHDTSRILTIADGDVDKIKQAYLFMLTQQGSPCIYYGSEIPMKGLKGPRIEDHRSCMTFDHIEKDFYKFMQRLIEIRHQESDIKLFDNEWHHINDHILCYQKNRIIVVMNLSESEQMVDLNKLTGGQIESLLASNTILQTNAFTLNGKGYFIGKLSS